MWDVLSTTVPANLGMRFEYIAVLLVAVLNLIPYAKDFKIGTILGMFSWGLMFIWFYTEGLYWAFPLVLFFINLIVLSFTLYAVDKKAMGFV